MRNIVFAAALAVGTASTVTPATAQVGAPTPTCDIGRSTAQMGIDFNRPEARKMKLYKIHNGKPVEVRIMDVMYNGRTFMLITQTLGTSSREPLPPEALFTRTEVEKRTRYDRLKAQGYKVCVPTLSREEAARRLEAGRKADTKTICTKYANEMRGGPKYDRLSYQRTLRSNCCNRPYVRELGYAPLCQRPLP